MVLLYYYRNDQSLYPLFVSNIIQIIVYLVMIIGCLAYYAINLLVFICLYLVFNSVTTNYITLYHRKSIFIMGFFQPVCEEPFTLEMELDDLPKETLKALIFEETENHYKRTQEAKLHST